MLLRWPAIGAFLPLIVYSMISLTVWAWRPELDRRRVVRLGIYSGVQLSLLFLVFIVLTSGIVTFIAVPFVVVPIGVAVLAVRFLARRARRFTILHLLILTTVCGSLVGLSRKLWPDAAAWLSAPVIAALPATPTLNAITYALVGWNVARRARGFTRVKRRWSIVSWLVLAAGWFVTWRIAIEWMLIEYSKLPTTDPNCYVSSAAAYGHGRFVGAELLCRSRRTGQIANLQMRRLKFLEFALMAACPRAHRLVRRYYDRVGPRFASICRRNVWFADLAFVSLKPLEAIAECLRWAARIPADRVQNLYRGLRGEHR